METPSRNWLVRVADGSNFKNSSHLCIWGIQKRIKTFALDVKENDRLWFIVQKMASNQKRGKVIAVAQFVSIQNRRENTITNEELGWVNAEDIDRLVYYKNLINLTNCHVYCNVRNQVSITSYEKNREKFNIDLYTEYNYIVRYQNTSDHM